MKIMFYILASTVVYWAFSKEAEMVDDEEGFSNEEKDFMLKLALGAIEHRLWDGPCRPRRRNQKVV